MSDTNLAGGCLCGAVRIALSGAPYRVGICHCLDCRKHHGAVFHTSAIFPVDAVTISGATAEYRNRHFCPTCGSSLFGRTGDDIEVHLGCLDAPNQLRPTYEIWVIRPSSRSAAGCPNTHHDLATNSISCNATLSETTPTVATILPQQVVTCPA